MGRLSRIVVIALAFEWDRMERDEQSIHRDAMGDITGNHHTERDDWYMDKAFRFDPSLHGDADVESLKLLGVCSPKPRHSFTQQRELDAKVPD